MPPHPEVQYLNLLADLLDHGEQRRDRTGVGTLALRGASLRFDLSQGEIPILTTKKVSWKTALRELLWMLSGSSNIRPLLEQGVHIWSEWPHASYVLSTGDRLPLAEFEARILADDAFAAQWGDLGPGTYGRVWRHWMGPDGREYDQIADVVELIKTNPFSRRILFHGWNVAEISRALLPSCHLLYQFQVTDDGRLNSLLFQCSSDSLIAVTYNICNLAFLVNLLAHQTDLRPGQIVWFGGDVHLYLNHQGQARLQLTRAPYPFPTLRMTRRPASFDAYRVDDFAVEGYRSHPPIAAPIAV